MALVTCKTCKKQTSDDFDACVHCGSLIKKPKSKAKRNFWLVLISLLVIALASVDKDPSNQSSDFQQAQSKQDSFIELKPEKRESQEMTQDQFNEATADLQTDLDQSKNAQQNKAAMDEAWRRLESYSASKGLTVDQLIERNALSDVASVHILLASGVMKGDTPEDSYAALDLFDRDTDPLYQFRLSQKNQTH